MLRNSHEEFIAEPVDPVRDRLAGERDTAPQEIGFHPIGRDTLDGLLVHDFRDK